MVICIMSEIIVTHFKRICLCAPACASKMEGNVFEDHCLSKSGFHSFFLVIIIIIYLNPDSWKCVSCDRAVTFLGIPSR